MSAATKRRQRQNVEHGDAVADGIHDVDAATDLFSVANCTKRKRIVLKTLRGAVLTPKREANEKRLK
ncbi:MAG: hypothetical protein JWM53_1885 [bacterium]|nr:hypothetical protein [bacterium]